MTRTFGRQCGRLLLAFGFFMANHHGFAQPGWAQTATEDFLPPGPTADTHSNAGALLMDEGRFDEAISEFRQAYELEARPAFLFHIGRGYERLGQANTALHFFRRFLATQPPESPERTEAQSAVASAPPPPSALPRDPVLMPSAELYETGSAQAPKLVSRWWFWAALGAVTIAAAAFGVAAWNAGGDSLPASDLGHKRLN